MSKNKSNITPNTINSQPSFGYLGVRTLTGLTLAEAITENARWRLEKTIAKTQPTHDNSFSVSSLGARSLAA